MAAARQAEAGLTKLLGEMSWLCRYGQVTNGDANRSRQEIIRLVLEVGASMGE